MATCMLGCDSHTHILCSVYLHMFSIIFVLFPIASAPLRGASTFETTRIYAMDHFVPFLFCFFLTFEYYVY